MYYLLVYRNGEEKNRRIQGTICTIWRYMISDFHDKELRIVLIKSRIVLFPKDASS